MNSIDLRERLEKAEANVAKIEKTIERHKAQAQKKLAIIEKNGWTLNRYDYTGDVGRNEDAYWTICEYEDKLSDAKNAEKKLAEAQRVAENWKGRLERQLEVERTLQTEIPEVFKQVSIELADLWTQWDINARERMKERKKELEKEYHADDDSYGRFDLTAYRAFSKAWRDLYSYSKEESLTKTDEEFRKINQKSAEDWLLDLYNRVYNITGPVIDCSNIYWSGKALNGIVVGENGSAEVETIDAGGYNIQKYHLRVLVKPLKLATL